MRHFLQLDEPTRRLAFHQTAADRSLPPVAVEKDFWVCWTLGILTGLPEIGPCLTFKGGTSLSKAWGLIQRFSEDIDLVLDRAYLGFATEEGDPERAPSKHKQKERLNDLRKVCCASVRERIFPLLEQEIWKELDRGQSWSLDLDKQDPDGQTLLYHYPSMERLEHGYLKPWVKIELGARSDIEPSEARPVRSFVAETFPQLFTRPEVFIRSLKPVRTFWEKAALLHEENSRPPDKVKKPYMARHYYDLARMIELGIGQEALERMDVFERVVAHRRVYFRQTWVDYDTLKPGNLCLRLVAGQAAAWENDYVAMRSEMFFGEAPPWPDVLNRISEFEATFNKNG